MSLKGKGSDKRVVMESFLSIFKYKLLTWEKIISFTQINWLMAN
ncbi:hypothetical protein J2N67_005970 (plasmid) [Bacillus thuringiensis]|nr:hypothetical protein J2N67_005970 [Bacillus thuringiensis]